MNPEFQRQIYLEFSISRLIGMPVFLLVILSSVAYLLDDLSFGKVVVTHSALGLYTLIVLFWGAKQAASSIFDELQNNTWDIQKTSAISAWSLAWGKLLGSTLYNWYGGFFCLLVYTLATPEPEFITLNWVYFLGSGLLTQGFSLLVSLFSLRRRQSFNTGFSYLLVLVALMFIVPVMLNSHDIYQETLYWYGESYNLAYFIGFSLIIACIWTIIGIYRLLVEALQIRTLPWIWLLFISFLIVYLTGFFIEDTGEPEFTLFMTLIIVCFGVCIIASYLLLFIDENNPMLPRKLWIYSQQAQWLRMWHEMPCWMISVILALPATLFLTLTYPVETIEEMHPYPLVIYLLMLRDISILLFFSYAANPKRAMGLTLLYMICLYGLLPAIFLSTDTEIIAGFILPVFNENLLLAISFSALQTLIIGFLLFQRWQKRVMAIGYN
jgi:hypothetical protein